jgi:hypothetical protein
MRAYDVALFVHLLGVITFFIAVGINQRGGARIREAQTVEHVRLWAGFVRTTQRMFPAAIVLLLGAGLFMTADVWTFATSWIVVGLVGLAVIVAVGIGVVGRRIEAIAAAAEAAGDGAVPPELVTLIADPVMWTALSALNGAAIGIVWLMATKPGWTGSVSVVLGLGLIGALVGSGIARRGRHAAEPPSRGGGRGG